MNRLNRWIDDDAPTQKFRTPSVAVARPTPAQRDGLWDANDVAGYLKVSRSWVYHRAEAGELPHLRVGGLLRFDPEVVRAFAKKK
jgi:excisionase family DNA binding protein